MSSCEGTLLTLQRCSSISGRDRSRGLLTERLGDPVKIGRGRWRLCTDCARTAIDLHPGAYSWEPDRCNCTGDEYAPSMGLAAHRSSCPQSIVTEIAR